MNSQTDYSTSTRETKTEETPTHFETELATEQPTRSPSRKNIFKQADFKKYNRYKSTPTTEYSSLNLTVAGLQQHRDSITSGEFSPVRRTAEWIDDQLIQPLLYEQNNENNDIESNSYIYKNPKASQVLTQSDNKLLQVLQSLDEIDRHYSGQVQAINSLPLEILLIIPAHMFNRAYALSGIVLSLLVGALRYDEMLDQLKYKVMKTQLGTFQKFRFGSVFMLVYLITLIAMVSSTQLLKYIFKRSRPEPLPGTQRLGNLRKAEVGTYSMPSGDAAAAALFCFLYATMVNLPLVYLLLPLVMLGRVYYHCHWFGDTFFGAVVGTLWGVVAFSQFDLLFSPFARIITGPASFVPHF